MDPTISKLLQQLYYNPVSGFTSEARLYQRAKEINPLITHKITSTFLNNQETAQIHKRRIIKQYYPLIATKPFQRIQVDLLDISNENPQQNNNYKFLFLAIDVFSRYVIAFPQKNKGEQECFQSFQALIAKVKELNYKLGQIDSDSEASFQSRSVKKLLQDHQITQNFAQVGDHHSLGVADRFCRTLRGYIAKYQVAYQTQRFIDVLPDLISNYNTAIHSTLKQSPVLAMLSNGISNYIPQQVKSASAQQFNREEFPVNTRVRLRIKKQLFDKGEQLFTKSLHTISDYRNSLYYVYDRVKGYRKEELLKVNSGIAFAPINEKNENSVDLSNVINNQVIQRRVARRIAKEGIPANNTITTDEEKSIRAVRRKPTNNSFMISDYDFE